MAYLSTYPCCLVLQRLFPLDRESESFDTNLTRCGPSKANATRLPFDDLRKLFPVLHLQRVHRAVALQVPR
jgi:hypothetical protein